MLLTRKLKVLNFQLSLEVGNSDKLVYVYIDRFIYDLILDKMVYVDMDHFARAGPGLGPAPEPGPGSPWPGSGPGP